MLIALTVTARTRGDKPTGIFIFNTEFLSELRVSGTGARFYYFSRVEDKAGSREQITVSETVAVIRTAINTDYATNVLTLNVYPQEDLTADTIVTSFNIKEVILAWQMGADYSTADGYGFKTYVLVNEKGSPKRYLVDNHYLDLISYSGTASTSTYTTHT